VISVRHLSKSFGTNRVLDDVSLEIAKGEVVCIIGASGSGKSTLLNILGCLDRPTAGSYRLVDDDVSTLDDRRLSHVRKTRIGFVFQSFQLVPHLTVAENVELPLFYARMPRRKRRELSHAILERVGLGHRCTHLPNELSGGECQRTAIARALVIEPSLMLADEPTGNLDSKTSAEIMRLFAELHAGHRTIVMITHDPSIAAQARRRITLKDGLIESDNRSSQAPTSQSATSPGTTSPSPTSLAPTSSGTASQGTGAEAACSPN
jgi:putative ABC transport system ATP-binding protein